MKCIFKNSVIFIGLLSLLTLKAFAQKDTISTLVVTNITQPDYKTIDFDLGVVRHTDSWRVWANGTYQITFADFPIDSSNLSIEFIADSSDLPLVNSYSQPMSGYLVSTAVLKDRISISILGPNEYGNGRAITIPDTDTLCLGRFRLRSIQAMNFLMPTFISWYKPYSKFQAHAFKTQTDSVASGVSWFTANDNVEMNSSSTSVRYFVNNPKILPTNDIEFAAKYKGAGRVDVTWRTTSEFFNRGFILRRGLRSPDEPDVITFDTEIGSFLKALSNNSLQDTALISKSVGGGGAEYSFTDYVEERGEQYVYELTDVSSAEVPAGTHDKDTTAVIIPFSVVSAAEVGPNPFSTKTTVSFFLEGKVNITIKVTNLVGKEVAILLDNITLEAGQHTVDFIVTELASNGLYNIVIEAVPVEEERQRGLSDESIIIIPVQLIR
jgi:hypothetical protein